MADRDVSGAARRPRSAGRTRRGPAGGGGRGGPDGADRNRRPAARVRLTSRAAVLAVVVCAITLSLAYPVREYVAQRREISALQAQQRATAARVRALQKKEGKLHDPHYIEQQARNRLHYCFPDEKCYIVLPNDKRKPRSGRHGAGDATPWFSAVWNSVKAADRAKR